ncbi:hypothetical protein KR52_07270 [Synechococcus sp. KORDI-52]|uniref:DUF5801 repeats-in-toxin domain-containing protein n=1 Tax=Synechococcus sp. KORDI-52 TaxID=585425 RepID=UPI0004E050B6|nr:DUF5801 repeats-in-toxin domain-containing protein [Synechococcus sp. KORDI-52]AII48940.1 hypothetical protein KR52_07270 [Synechococcus sp. KORDI-52]
MEFEFDAQAQSLETSNQLSVGSGSEENYQSAGQSPTPAGFKGVPLNDYLGFSESFTQLPPPAFDVLISGADPVLVPATLGGADLPAADLALAPEGALVFVPEALAAAIDNGVAFEDEDPAVQAALEDLDVDVDPAVAPAADADPTPTPEPTPDPDPVPLRIEAEDFGTLLTFDGGINGNFVGTQSREDSDGSPLISKVDFSNNFSIGGAAPGAIQDVNYSIDFAQGFNNGDQLTLTSGGSPVFLIFDATNNSYFGSLDPNDTSSNSQNVVFEVSVGARDGIVIVEQFKPIDHTNGIDNTLSNAATNLDLMLLENGALILSATVTETSISGDVQTATAFFDLGGNIQFADDGPLETTAVTADLTGLDLLTGDGGLPGGNDTALPASDNADGIDVAQLFINAVTPDYGADNPGSQSASSFQFASSTTGLTTGNTTGVDTGLTLSDGTTIVYAYLSADGQTLTGSTDANGSITPANTAFTIQIDGATGEVSQTQLQALAQSNILKDGSGLANVDGEYSNDRVDLADGGLNLSITADVTTTDADGDVVTNDSVTSADVASAFVFGDDGPISSTVSNPTAVLRALADSLILDETRPVGDDRADTANGENAENPPGTDTASADLAGVFTDANSATAGLQVDYGADGPGSVAYALTLTQTSSQSGDILSGIYALDPTDTETTVDGYGQGEQLILVEGSTLTGGDVGTIYGVLPAATDAADSYFTIANTGTSVTFSQQKNVWHNDTNNFDEGGPTANSGRLIVTNGSLGLQQTVTDADGDFASSTADLSGSTSTDGFSVFSIQDDGPILSIDADENSLGVAITYDGNTTKNGNYQFDSGNGIDIPATPGNSDTATLAAANVQAVFSTTSDPGTDGGSLGTPTYQLVFDVNNIGKQVNDLSGTAGTGWTSDGTNVVWSEIDSGTKYAGVLEGSSTKVFQIKINTNNGKVTVRQFRNLDHTTAAGASDGPESAQPYSDDNLTLADSQLSVQQSITLTDGDGDTTTATADFDLGGNIQFGDDGPGNPTLVVSGTEPIALTFDGGLSPAGNFVGAELAGDTNASPVIAEVDFSSAFTPGNLSDYGADGPGSASTVSYALALTGPTDSGLTSGGTAITLSESGGVITGSAGGNTAFTLAVNSTTGVVTLTQSLAIDHPLPQTYNGAYISSPEDLASLADGLIQLNASATATTDSDGDSSSTATASLDLGGNIQFGDDGPGNPTLVVSGTEPIALTFDGGLSPAGNFVGAELAGDTNASPVIAEVDFSSAFTPGNLSDYGADGPGSASTVSYALALTGPTDSGLTSGGTAITLSESGGVITGSAGGNTAFTLAVNSTTGVVTLTQSLAIDHPLPQTYNGAYISSPEDLASLADGLIQLNASATATTDSDGDSSSTATASLDLGGNIQFGDDGPEIDAGIFTASQQLQFNVVVGDDRGDNQIDGTPNFNYSDFSRIALNFDSIYANQTITIDLDVEISGSWNYDGVGDSSGNVFANFFDDNWSIFIPDNPIQEAAWRLNGGPGSSATADEIFFYNANAGATGYPQDEPFYDNLATQGITYAPPSNVNTNFTFSHTAQVTGTLDSNGDFEFWVGGETTQKSEIATIEGISNVQLTGPQLPGAVLIQVENINATYANQNLASWNFGADGINALAGYDIEFITQGYTGVISQGATAQNVELTISKAGSAVAVLNLNSDVTANDSLQIIATGQQEDIEFNLKVKDGDDDIDSIEFDIELGTANANTIPANTQLYRDEFENSNSSWSSQGGIINNNGELEIRSGNSREATKTFEFGQDNAGKQVEVSFDAETQTNWETFGGQNDRFRVRANGSTVLQPAGNNNQQFNFQATLNTNGELQVEIHVLTSSNSETLRIDNFTIVSLEEFVETSFLAILPNVNPISIDLNSDGKINYLSRGEGQSFEDVETNVVSNIAWVAPDDGLLVIDADQSGTINQTKEFAFTEWSDQAKTDLEAVAEVFDTNQDGVLSEQDEQFANFAVWQDLNSDAKTDEGELLTLSELGIESIDLTYRESSQERSDADGDVTVLGQANINYEDGSVGLAEDTTFARTVLEEDQSSNNNQSDQLGTESTARGEASGIALTAELVDQYLETSPVEDETAAEADASSTASTSELVDQYLETNPVGNEIAAEVEQDLMSMESESDSLGDEMEGEESTLNERGTEEVSEDDLDLEVEMIEISMDDSFETISPDVGEDYSSAAV